MKRAYKELAGVISAISYASFTCIANVLSTKITLLPLFFTTLAIDGGTLIYPLTFTLRDFVHKSWGKKMARQVVIWTAIINVLMVVLFYIVGKMIPDSSWANQQAYEVILMPVWRITAASIIAMVISELIDTEMFSFLYKRLHLGDTKAVLGSNAISTLIDSIVFTTIAFVGSLPIKVVISIIFGNIIIKYVVSVFVAPLIRKIPRLADFEQM